MKRLLILAVIYLLPVALSNAQIMEEDTESEETKPPSGNNISAERKAMDLLAKFQKPNSVVWLQAEGEEFLGLYQPALKSKARGGVLMLHAEGQHPDWPGSLSYLRQHLAEWGWNTLSIALPAPNPPKRPTSMAKDADRLAKVSGEVLDETEEIFDPETNSVSDGSVTPESEITQTEQTGRAEEIAIERIVSAMNHLTSKSNGKVVLYGQGLGALRASRFWQETGNSNVTALVFVDALNGLKDSDYTLPQSLSNVRMPILDVIQSRSTVIDIDAKQRKQQAAMNNLGAFQQQQFTENPELLGTTVYGFLRRHSK